MEYYSSLDASQLDSETPTIFEIISANQLEALLSPSLRFVLVHYAQKYPGLLLKLANWFDEVNLVLRSVIEFYFLNQWQGSFTENFYGLKRVSQTPLSIPKYAGSKVMQLIPSMIQERRRLTKLQKLVSVIEITGTSYLLEKLIYNYELLYSKYVTNQLKESELNSKNENRVISLQRFFVNAYPYFQTTWRLSNLAATIMYMSGVTKSASLITLLFKINFSRLKLYDYNHLEPLGLSKNTSAKAIRNRPLSNTEALIEVMNKYFTRTLGRAVKYILGTFFPLAIFTLKFLEWWNNSDFAQTLARQQNNSLDTIVPPPSVLDRLKHYYNQPKKIYQSGNVCPLCKEEISNPAIIETGYVFCYTCIFNYLRDSHKLVRERVKQGGEAYDDSKDNESCEDDDEDEDTDEDANDKKKAIKETEIEEIEKFGNKGISEKDASVKSDVNAQNNQSPKEKIKNYTTTEISRGGRCPVTGRKLLGCKWNELKGEFDVDGIQRLIF